MNAKVWIGTLLLVAICESVAAQQSDEAHLVKKWMKFYSDRAAQYVITAGDDGNRPLDLHPTPLLKYTNPVRQREQHGSVFAWTLDGRPQVIGTLWSIVDRNDAGLRRTAHEMHSLSEQPLFAERPPAVEQRKNPNRKVSSWNPRQAGVRFAAIDFDQPIAKDARSRLLQLRRIASQFTAVAIDKDDGSEIPLRQLPSPVMRYECPSKGIVDGAVFAYVVATDPELFLVLECRSDDQGQTRWHYAAARFTFIALRLHRQGQEVWKCERVKPNQPGGVYNLSMGVSVLAADDPPLAE